jgi:hypothetical protein
LEVFKKSEVRAGERPAAEDNRADGAGSLLIGDVHETAWRFSIDGHFRNDGNAHSRANHAEQAAELTTFKHNLRVKTRSVAGSDSGVPEAMAITQQQEGFGAEVFQ